MKYIPADKLIAEIERYKKGAAIARFDNAGENAEYFQGKVEMCNDLMHIITSLQQEQSHFADANKTSNLEHWLAFFGMPKENIENCATQIAQGYGACRYLQGVQHGAEAVNELAQPEQPNNMIQWTGNNLKEVIDFTGKSPRFGEYFNSWEEYENYVHTHNDILKLFCEDGGHYEVPVGAWIVKTPDGYNVPSVAKYIQRVQPESPFLIEKAILWFNNIAESAKKLSAGNVSHLAPTIAGMAIRAAEFFEKRPLEAPEVDLEKALDEYYKNADFGPSEAIEYEIHKDIASHFYELGRLNARKVE